MTFDLGLLEYGQAPVQSAGGLSQTDQIIIGVCVAAFFIMVLIVVIFIVVRFNRMSSRKNREYRQLLNRLNALESSVRDQCKQGENDRSSLPVNKMRMSLITACKQGENIAHYYV